MVDKTGFRRRWAEMLRACHLDRQTFERVAKLNNTQIVTGWLARGRVGVHSEELVQAATAVSMDWLQRNQGVPFPAGPIEYDPSGRPLPRRKADSVARSMQPTDGSPIVEDMLRGENRTYLVQAIDMLDSALEKYGVPLTAAGKAECLAIIYEGLRAGSASPAILRRIASVVRALGNQRTSRGSKWTKRKSGNG